jgi:hypothetical protein
MDVRSPLLVVVSFFALLGCQESAAATCTKDYFESAAFAGDRRGADLVAECREYLLQERPNRKQTLGWIAGLGDVDLFKALLDIGYAIEPAEDHNLIFYALEAEQDPAEMVAFLIVEGLSVDAANDALNVLYHAIELGHSRTLQILVEHLSDQRALYAPAHLFAAILPNNLAIADEILVRGGDPNFVEDEHGITPLMIAVDRGSAEMVQLLIRRGADCWRKGSIGSAFDIAATEDKRTLLKQACGANAPADPQATEPTP